jgi:hypothetical protein
MGKKFLVLRMLAFFLHVQKKSKKEKKNTNMCWNFKDPSFYRAQITVTASSVPPLLITSSKTKILNDFNREQGVTELSGKLVFSIAATTDPATVQNFVFTIPLPCTSPAAPDSIVYGTGTLYAGSNPSQLFSTPNITVTQKHATITFNLGTIEQAVLAPLLVSGNNLTLNFNFSYNSPGE